MDVLGWRRHEWRESQNLNFLRLVAATHPSNDPGGHELLASFPAAL
jgi:hypothetical protein